jgi:hypothetical protein
MAPGIEHSADSAILGYALPAQIGQVRAKCRPLRPMPHDARLDGNVARPITHHPGRCQARRPSAPEASGRASRSPVNPAGSLGGDQRLCDEWLGSACAPSVPNSPRANSKIIVAAHDARPHEVHVLVQFHAVVRIGRLLCIVTPLAKCLMQLRSSNIRPCRTLRLLSCPRSLGWPPSRLSTQTCDKSRHCAKRGSGTHRDAFSADLAATIAAGAQSGRFRESSRPSVVQTSARIPSVDLSTRLLVRFQSACPRGVANPPPPLHR